MDHRTEAPEARPPPGRASWAQTSTRWKVAHPATIMMCGPTGSGKTSVLAQLVNRGMFEPQPAHIIVFHGSEQDYQLPAGTQFIKGWSTEAIDNLPADSLVIVDDLMSEVKNCKYMSKLFTKISHHRRISVVWLVQNIFPRGRECRDISLNSQYIILFRNPRDQAQVCIVSMFFCYYSTTHNTIHLPLVDPIFGGANVSWQDKGIYRSI